MVELVYTGDFKEVCLVYKEYKVYGPYKRKDGRQHVVLVSKSKKRKTVSYPKFIMEKHLNRYLDKNETIDHIDGDFNNNDLSNLQVLDRSIHVSLDVKRYSTQNFICPLCGVSFQLKGRKLHDAIWNRKKQKAGPFCSRSCAGKYAKSIQLDGEKLQIVQIVPKYTKNK